MTESDISWTKTGREAAAIGFLLIDDFALLSFASVSEPFRAANRLAGETLYGWRHLSLDGSPVRASNGSLLNVEGAVEREGPFDLILVCAGGNPATFADQPAFAPLRRLAAQGTIIGGVSAGPFVLARAGLLDGYRCTVHWEHRAAFLEAFPRAILERGLFTIDRNRVTCAGGTAGLDLAIHLIRAAHGARLAQQVSDWFIRTEDRGAERAQRASIVERYGLHHKGLNEVLAAMETHSSEPLALAELARMAGRSPRQLERLFRDRLGTSPGAHYVRIRLELARRLLAESDLSITEVAIASGFLAPAHFSRAFRRLYGSAPGAWRRALRSGS